MQRFVGMALATVTVALMGCATTPEPPERAWVWMFVRPPTAQGCDFTVGPYDGTDYHFVGVGREVLPKLRERAVSRQYVYSVSGGSSDRPAPGQPQCLTITRVVGASGGPRTATIGLVLTAIDENTVEIRVRKMAVRTSALWKRTYSPIAMTLALEAKPSIPDAATVRSSFDLGSAVLRAAESDVDGRLLTPWPVGESLQIKGTVTETRARD